jgi:hypothetical protein
VAKPQKGDGDGRNVGAEPHVDDKGDGDDGEKAVITLLGQRTQDGRLLNHFLRLSRVLLRPVYIQLRIVNDSIKHGPQALAASAGTEL